MAGAWFFAAVGSYYARAIWGHKHTHRDREILNARRFRAQTSVSSLCVWFVRVFLTVGSRREVSEGWGAKDVGTRGGGDEDCGFLCECIGVS